jgi:glycosyltransferase involved in cell wall biosynthesis
VGGEVAEYTRRCLGSVCPAVAVIHNGFDDELFRVHAVHRVREPSQKITLGTAARLVAIKGIDRVLKALAGVELSRPWEYLVAGEGNERERLQTLAIELNCADRVRFLGAITDMPSFYSRLDLYIHGSLSEGLPLAIAEAMACGVPVVATDVGATRELVRDGTDGFVVPPDNVAALRTAIERLAGSDDLRARMGAAAHERAWSGFSSTHIVESVLKVYKAILGERVCGS